MPQVSESTAIIRKVKKDKKKMKKEKEKEKEKEKDKGGPSSNTTPVNGKSKQDRSSPKTDNPDSS
jgi:hypothetical protein